MLTKDIDERTCARFRQMFAIDDDRGCLVWKVPAKSHSNHLGMVAGYLQKATGYWAVKVDRKLWKVHRVMWAIAHGPIGPCDIIDHINQNARDNRLSNLRKVTHKQNAENRNIPRGSSGVRGVYPILSKWLAEIKHKDERIYLGTYETKQEAYNVRLDAERRLFSHSLACRCPQIGTLDSFEQIDKTVEKEVVCG